MKRDFLINGIILLVTNFVVRPMYLFGIEMKIQNTVGPEEYGLFFLVFDFVFLFLAINDPGLQSYSSRTLAVNRGNLQAVFKGILGAKLVLSICFIIFALAAAWFLDFDTRRLYLIFLVALGMVLSSTFVLLRTALSGAGHYKIDSFISSIDRFLMIIVLGAIVWMPAVGIEMTIEVMVYAQLFCYFLSCLVCIFFLLKYKLFSLPEINLAKILKILKETLPYAGVILLTSICNRIDVVMLNGLLPEKEALFQSGIYAAGYRFLDAANMIGFLFGALLVPMYANEMSQGRSIGTLFNFSFKLLLVLAAIIGIGAIGYSDEIFKLCYTLDYSPHAAIMYPLMLSLIPITLTNVFGSLIMATGKLKTFNYILSAGIVINVLMNLYCIPNYGAIGAAYATFVTELFLIIGAYLSAVRLSGSSLDLNTLGRSFLFLSLSVCFALFLAKVDLPWFGEVLVFAMVTIILAFASKLLQIQDFGLIIKK